MKKQISGLIGILITTVLWSAAESNSSKSSWGVSGQSETVGVYRNTTGSGANTTNDGTSFRQDLGIKTKGKIGDAKAGVEVRGRATNDKRVSPNTADLLSFRSYYTTERLNVEVGDVAKMYNPLIFSNSLKGGKVGVKQKVGETKSIEYSMIGGIQSSSWKETFQQEQDQRDAIAAEVKYRHNRAQSLALSVSYAKDRLADSNTTPAFDRNSSEALSAGLQWDWRFNRYLRFKGDTAVTNTTNTLTGGSAETKTAVRMTLYTKPVRSVNSNFKYERYDGGFNTLVGSATQDRERMENTTSWAINRQLRSRMTLKYSRDNLDGKSLSGTQKIYDGLVSLNYRPDFVKRGDIGLRLQYTERDGRGLDTKQTNAGVDFTDRLKSGWRYGFGYEFTDYQVDSNGSGDNQLHTLRGNVGWKHNFDKTNRVRVTLKLDISLFDNSDSNLSQKRFGGTFDAGYDFGRQFAVDALFTSKNTNRDLSDNTSYELYQLISQYRPFGTNGHVLKLNLQRRDYHGSTTTGSYVEDEARLAYAFAF